MDANIFSHSVSEPFIMVVHSISNTREAHPLGNTEGGGGSGCIVRGIIWTSGLPSLSLYLSLSLVGPFCDHLLALDMDEDPDRLAKKADQLFQSHQASSLNLISGEPIPPVFALHPPKPRPRQNSNSSSSYSTTSGRSSTPAASHRHQRSPSPVSSTCWFHRTQGDKA